MPVFLVLSMDFWYCFVHLVRFRFHLPQLGVGHTNLAACTILLADVKYEVKDDFSYKLRLITRHDIAVNLLCSITRRWT